ncbi:unnamed protein product [Alternaria alternata]
MIITSILCLVFTHFFVVTPFYQLSRNYLSARKTGLRIIISPITPYTLQWRLLTSLCGSYLQQYRCDPKTIEHVLKKWREFVKPDNVNEILGTFGQNVDTSNGDDWIRHRKLTAPCFNERASATVWSESMRQSKIMIEQWLSSSDGKWKSMIKDTSTLALNVISSVAFENTEVNKPTPGHALSLRDTLVTVMSTSISPTMEGILPFLQFPILQSLLPSDVKDLLQAMHEFRQYMDEIIVTEREAMTSGQTRVSALISTLIEASGQVKTESRASKVRLSDTELRGNIFIFLVGGLESTSITLSYAIALLAVHPDIQDWVVEELDGVLSDNVNSEMEYVRVFPRLKRVMAVMLNANDAASTKRYVSTALHHLFLGHLFQLTLSLPFQ